jgi:hypothetical protein
MRSPQVVRRRFSRRHEGEPPVAPVGRRTIQEHVLHQLGVEVRPELVLLPNGPITDYGEYKVPLNLRAADGGPVEVTVNVLKVRRSQ